MEGVVQEFLRSGFQGATIVALGYWIIRLTGKLDECQKARVDEGRAHAVERAADATNYIGRLETLHNSYVTRLETLNNARSADTRAATEHATETAELIANTVAAHTIALNAHKDGLHEVRQLLRDQDEERMRRARPPR